MMLVVEHGAIELEYRAGPEREIGAVGHYQPRGAVEPGANNFVTDQSIANLDLAGRRSGNAEHFVLDDGGFADAGLRVDRTCRQEANCKQKKKAVTKIHFIADRLIPTSHRIAHASDVAELSQAAPCWPVG